MADIDQITNLIKKEISSYEDKIETSDVGTVVSVGDGIATIYGLDKAMYGELLEFPNHVYGMVMNLNEDSVGCVLLGKDSTIFEGDPVKLTGKVVSVPVGDGLLGRVVNALGEPIDGNGEIVATDTYPIESPAPGIMTRESVNEPLETGIKAIDSMIPIGKGQRELLIGDRQTGKTAIAIDTIINQKGKDVICIYCAIGQKNSTIAQIVSKLKDHGAFDYTVIVNASASESAPMLYVAPYAATSMGEYWEKHGKNVLIIYDDLSKHAVAYRALSLLLKRSPGREAYPGDIFYLHSRLLERAARMADEYGGGSITALPIVETQAGDVSAYIPTNIISITDGQIFLESELFFSGQRPAINVGISVSRVGGDAQTKAMKKAVGTLKLDLAQYREMEVFSQFASDLDEQTRKQLIYGQGLMRMLRQSQYHPYSHHQQVIMLVSAMAHVMVDVELDDVQTFIKGLLEKFETEYPEIGQEIDREKVLSDELKGKITEVAQEYAKDFLKRK